MVLTSVYSGSKSCVSVKEALSDKHLLNVGVRRKFNYNVALLLKLHVLCLFSKMYYDEK